MSKTKDEEFLEQVAQMEARGLKMGDIALELGFNHQSQLTAKLNRLGYKSKLVIVNTHTNAPLSDLVKEKAA